MNNWDKLVARYPKKFQLEKEEEAHLHISLQDAFAANLQGERYIFARFLTHPVWTHNQGPWRYLDDDSPVTYTHLCMWFANNHYLNLIDTKKGTAKFNGKKVQWEPTKEG